VTEVANRNNQPEKGWEDMHLVERLAALDSLLPHDIMELIPRDLPQEEFVQGMGSCESLEHKGALWWGQFYRLGLELYGQEFYQSVDGLKYQKSTLNNYARLTTQIHPELWEEHLPDRHFMAIAQNTDPYDLEEQRRWVEYAKKHEPTSDQLRDQIHKDLEARGLRKKPVTVDWVICYTCLSSGKCQTCQGEGGWPEDQENSA
jgi:hypothetical protein